jgi:hypothetical protein
VSLRRRIGHEPGRRLGLEFARRLGRSRCAMVSYPTEPCVPDSDGVLRPAKDLNEVLHHFGSEAVLGCIDAAKPFPVQGLYKLTDSPSDRRSKPRPRASNRSTRTFGSAGAPSSWSAVPPAAAKPP